MTDTVSAAPPQPGVTTAQPSAALTAAARQMEAVFLRQMLAAMRSASLGDELFGSSAVDQFRDMGDAHLADAMSGRFGIADMLAAQLAGKR